jgi:hypothetical protein
LEIQGGILLGERSEAVDPESRMAGRVAEHRQPRAKGDPDCQKIHHGSEHGEDRHGCSYCDPDGLSGVGHP